jgi:general secretion pathway protein D
VNDLEKTNLLVFLRPTILRDSATAGALTREKYELIRTEQQGQGEAGVPLLPGATRPELPEYEETRPAGGSP